MATSYSASITFKHDLHRVRTVLTRGSSPVAVQTFINAIKGLTTADIPKFSFTQSFDLEITGTGQDISDVDFVLRIQLKGPNGFDYFDLPAPALTLFDHVENTGYRFKQVPGAAFATAWSTLTGETFTFVAGWLVG